MPKSIKLISWNVNGIRAVYKKNFKSFLTRQKADIVCLQETKAWVEQLEDSQVHPGKYTGYFSEAEKKGYSGTATFIKDDSGKTPYSTELTSPKFFKEGRFSISEHEDFNLYNIYFPSGSSGDVRQKFKYDFLDDFYDHLKSLSTKERKRLVICGDFNICHKEIDIHHPKQAERLELSGFLPEERAWMDEFSDLGFTDVFRHVHGDKKDKYTWWSYRGGAREKNLGWRIDYFFVGSGLADKISDAKIMAKTGGSDHCPISLELKL